MKVIVVRNPHDAQTEAKIPAALDSITESLHDAEFHTVDFMVARGVLSVRTAPCVMLLLDELEDEFDAEDITVAIDAARAAIAAKRQQQATES